VRASVVGNARGPREGWHELGAACLGVHGRARSRTGVFLRILCMGSVGQRQIFEHVWMGDAGARCVGVDGVCDWVCEWLPPVIFSFLLLRSETRL